MSQIPRPALLLGLAGVLPFAAFALAPLWLPGEFLEAGGRFALLLYAQTILAFMSGCIWAFAARAEDPVGYGLSTLPALFGFLVMTGIMFLGGLPPSVLPVVLAFGFAGLLLLDARAARLQQTPPWWMPLRVLLTGLVSLFLVIGTFL